MADLKLTTKQYIALMRAVAAAMTLDEHVAEQGKSDAELTELWEGLMDRAEDFGMSFPPEDTNERHWSDDMFAEADDTLHEFMDAEFLHLLSTKLAGEEHARQCGRDDHSSDGCRNDFIARTMLWQERLGEGGEELGEMLRAS